MGERFRTQARPCRSAGVSRSLVAPCKLWGILAYLGGHLREHIALRVVEGEDVDTRRREAEVADAVCHEGDDMLRLYGIEARPVVELLLAALDVDEARGHRVLALLRRRGRRRELREIERLRDDLVDGRVHAVLLREQERGRPARSLATAFGARATASTPLA